MNLTHAIVAVALALSAAAAAEERYPAKPVEIIVPYAPGGAAEIIARPLALQLEKLLGQPFLIINKPGASGAIGTRALANAARDGYTVGVCVVQVSILPVVDDLFGRSRQYSVDQLTGVARLTADPVLFLVSATTGWSSLNDLIAAAKRQPGKIEFSSGGNYAGNHLPVELFAQQLGLEFLHVPYKSGGPAMAAALTGEVKLTAAVPGVSAPHLASGKVRAVGHSGARRLVLMPNSPTLMEQGADVEFYLWTAMFAPAGTPQRIVDILDGAVARAMSDPQFVAIAEKTKTELAYMGSTEFNAWWAEDARKLTEVVKKIGRLE